MRENPLKKWHSQLLKGTLELYILATISEQDRYAFEIIQALKALEGMVSEGSIYPLLKRLQKDTLISTYWSESESGPPRKYYQLTDKGKDTLKAMEKEWHQFSNFLNQTLKSAKETSNENSNATTSSDSVPLQFRKAP